MSCIPSDHSDDDDSRLLEDEFRPRPDADRPAHPNWTPPWPRYPGEDWRAYMERTQGTSRNHFHTRGSGGRISIHHSGEHFESIFQCRPGIRDEHILVEWEVNPDGLEAREDLIAVSEQPGTTKIAVVFDAFWGVPKTAAELSAKWRKEAGMTSGEQVQDVTLPFITEPEMVGSAEENARVEDCIGAVLGCKSEGGSVHEGDSEHPVIDTEFNIQATEDSCSQHESESQSLHRRADGAHDANDINSSAAQSPSQM